MTTSTIDPMPTGDAPVDPAWLYAVQQSSGHEVVHAKSADDDLTAVTIDGPDDTLIVRILDGTGAVIVEAPSPVPTSELALYRWDATDKLAAPAASLPVTHTTA